MTKKANILLREKLNKSASRVEVAEIERALSNESFSISKSELLWQAIENGHAGIVRVLLNKGADPREAYYNRYSAIFTAAYSRNEKKKLEIMQFLVEHDPTLACLENERKETPLYLSSFEGDSVNTPKIIQLLLDH